MGVGAVLVITPMSHPYHELSSPAGLAGYDSTRPVVVFGSGILTSPNSTSKAMTYDPALAPFGAALTAAVIPTSEGSTAEFTVLGLLPNRSYAVYAYTKPCGVTADAAGTRFQYRPDPATSGRARSTDPKYANPDNEIWLGVRTDTAGAGTSHTTVPFVLTDRVPRSMVVHDKPIEPGQAGTRDLRIACLTLSRR